MEKRKYSAINARMMVMVVSLERQLQKERQILFEAIVGQKAIPVGLPYPPVPVNYISKLNTQCLADADYVLLLIGTEYGALTDKGISLIHASYAAAKASRKPIISFIYNGGSASAPHRDEFDRKRLSGFIKQLETGRAIYWQDHDSLRDNAEMALEYLFESAPSTGWVKGRCDEIDAFDHQLVVQLRDQVYQLTKRLRLMQPKPASVDLITDDRLWLFRYQCNAFREGRLKQTDGEIPLALKDVFDYLSPTLLAPASENRIQLVLANKMHDQVLQTVQSQWPGCHAVSDVKVNQSSIDEIKVLLRSMKLIRFDGSGRWQLSEEGEALALKSVSH